MYICNDQKLITNHIEKPIKVEGFIANKVLLGRKKVKIRLGKKNGLKILVLTFTNVFYLPNSPSNLVSLSFFNDTGIYYYNKDQILYNQST